MIVSDATATVPVTAPTRSSGGGRSRTGPWCSTRRPATSAAAEIGTAARNTTRQVDTSRMPAATVGATAAPNTPIADHHDTTRPCSSSGNSGSTAASDAGSIIETPIAWTTRATITSSIVGATPDAAAPSVNTARPRRKIVRRPMRSASRPPRSIKVTWATLNADTTHEIVVRPASGNSSSITGTAMLVAVPTNAASSMPVAATASARWDCEAIEGS